VRVGHALRVLLVVSLCACHRPGSHGSQGSNGAGGAGGARGPTVGVTVEVPGLRAEEVEVSTTDPLEQACRGVAHVAHLHSVSQAGRSSIDVELEPGADVGAATAELERRVRAIGASLAPSAAPAVVARADGIVVARYALWSDRRTLAELEAFQQSELAGRFGTIAGVGRVATCGGAFERVLVDVDPVVLQGMGLTVGDVVTAVAAAPAPGAADALSGVVIALLKGAPIRLRDVARVLDDVVAPPCSAFDARGGAVSEGVVQASAVADVAAARSAVEDALGAVVLTLPPDVVLRRVAASRRITVDLRPDSDPGGWVPLRDAVAGGAAGVHALVEVGSADNGGERDASPTEARVLLDTTDDAVVARVLAAVRAVPFVRSAGEASATVQLLGADPAALAAAGAELTRRLTERGELVEQLGADTRWATHVIVDPVAVRRLGVSPADVDLALAARQGTPVGTYRQGGRVVPIVVRLADHAALRSSERTLVPLEAIAASRVELERVTVLHEDRRPMVGARVHGADLAALKQAFTPPAGIEMRVVGD